LTRSVSRCSPAARNPRTRSGNKPTEKGGER
jgi:hypothetical protein